MGTQVGGALAGVGIMQLMRDRMAWVDQRQSVLAQNIANADTPGYVPSDLAPFGAAITHRSLMLERTAAAHLVGAATGTPNAQQESGVVRSPDGNGVNLDSEMMHIADNQTTQKLTSQLYGKYLSLFRLAIDRTG